jgi:hypothetical protein
VSKPVNSKEFTPKPLLNAKGLGGHSKNESIHEKDMQHLSGSYIQENTQFLSSTQKVSKVSYIVNNQSMNQDDAKSFLNSTLTASNYNSNNIESRNNQNQSKANSRNGTQQ